jgi:hypothetical protein
MGMIGMGVSIEHNIESGDIVFKRLKPEVG